jgi:hypothetical protein
VSQGSSICRSENLLVLERSPLSRITRCQTTRRSPRHHNLLVTTSHASPLANFMGAAHANLLTIFVGATSAWSPPSSSTKQMSKSPNRCANALFLATFRHHGHWTPNPQLARFHLVGNRHGGHNTSFKATPPTRGATPQALSSHNQKAKVLHQKKRHVRGEG